MTTVGTVLSAHRYPVKSALGEQVPLVHLGPAGVHGDRGRAVVDTGDGTVASGKHPRKWGALLQWQASYVDEPVPGQALPPVLLEHGGGTTVRSDEPRVHGVLSAALGREVCLSDEPLAGGLFEEVWPDVEGLAPAEFVSSTTTGQEQGDPVSALALGMLTATPTFLDLAPVHLMTTSTLTAMAGWSPGSRFDVARYRPNLVLQTDGSGTVEDDWVGTVLRLGDVELAPSMLTMRCVMTTLAQGDLPEDRDTLRGIARHHRLEIPGLGTWACAGVYADVRASGAVRVGDAVTTG